ncbi:tetratricopeptide repeat protein [uncultured Streptomyces sp.]|uniref:tetratricopeptide repeat protein n=1 Tax=uncultured Streptomyces sp. TaxID=174707 RepID=UPI002633F26E|nr:tetratricopeptide repeat protein [uncultured Streptomyces sp.]
MSAPDKDELLAEAVKLREEGRTDEARERLLALTASFPEAADVAYQTAWVHDVLGLEAEAVPYYERSLSKEGLSDEERRGALVGLGSTYRVLGRYGQAVEILRMGVSEFPDDGALRTFLSMALYNMGEHHEAMELLLRLVAATSRDASVSAYRTAVEGYAADLDATL